MRRLAAAILLLTLGNNASALTWTRKVVTEGRGDGRTLLLIYEVADDANILPRVILRKSFARNESAALARTIQTTARPADLTTAVPTNNPLWPIDRQWTDQDEIDYGNWIHTNATENILEGGGIDVDCADFAMALRWIYSHDHHLPAGNSLIGGRPLFGSWMSTDVWDKLPTNADWKKDERFKAALRYLLDLSFTHTIFLDLYPVAVTPEFITPGAIYLTLDGETGHTRTLTNVGTSPDCSESPDCMIIIWGNEPAQERGYITEFVPWWLAQTDGGFMRFRWPEKTATGWQLRDPKLMRGYSLEQYSWDPGNYVTEVAGRLNVWQTPEARMLVAGASTDRLLQQRLMAVMNGYVMCSLVPCKPTDPIYNDYSTPSRDKALALSIQNFQVLLAKVDPSSPELDKFKQDRSNPVFGGAPFTTFDVLSSNLVSSFNPDPTVDFFARWGVTNPDADHHIKALAQIGVHIWIQRLQLVNQAVSACFPQGGSTPACNPQDPNIKKLATDRMDQGLRELRKAALPVYAQASSTTQQAVDDYLQHYEVGPELCGSNHDQFCSVYDFILGPVDHMATMTSNPDSPYLKRMGF